MEKNQSTEKDVVDIYESTMNTNRDKKSKNDERKKPEIESEDKTLSLLEFSKMVKEFDRTNTTIDETIRDLDYTLSKKEPKKGIWLLEQGEDIDYLDSLSMQEVNDSRIRGRHTWNQAMENIIQNYAPDYSLEEEYNALKIMEQNHKKKKVVADSSEPQVFKKTEDDMDVSKCA